MVRDGHFKAGFSLSWSVKDGRMIRGTVQNCDLGMRNVTWIY